MSAGGGGTPFKAHFCPPPLYFVEWICWGGKGVLGGRNEHLLKKRVRTRYIF